MHAITQSDSQRLAKLEAVVFKGKKAFVEVGNALKEIRDAKLYKSTHGTFAAYVEDRFGFKRANAYHLIDAADVSARLSDKSDKVQTATQAKEVAKAPPERQAEVVAKAAEIAEQSGKPATAATYKQAVAMVCDDEWEDVDDDDLEPEVALPKQETSKERAAKMKAAIKSHNAAMMRMVDDLQAIRPNRTQHEQIHEAFRTIHEAVEGWK